MSTATKQRGISFSAPMVRAIAAGNKTRTRRVMKPQPEHVNANTDLPAWDWHPPHAKFSQQVGVWIPGAHWVAGKNPEDTGAAGVIDFAPHRIGENLYVKEALENIGGWVAYAADSQCALDEDADCVPWKWKRNRLPGIYMPRRCARHFIEITGIRVERLQEISHEDAIAEGFGDIAQRNSAGRPRHSPSCGTCSTERVHSTPTPGSGSTSSGR